MLQEKIMQDGEKLTALSRLGRALGYLASGAAFLDLVRYVFILASAVGEAAFGIATIFLRVSVSAHPLLLGLFSVQALEIARMVSLVILSVVPELLVVSALVLAFRFWELWRVARKGALLVWVLLLTIPAIGFVFVSLSLLVSSFAPAPSASVFLVSCLCGWWYMVARLVALRTFGSSVNALSLRSIVKE